MNALTLRGTLVAPAVAAVLLCGCSSADWPAFRHDARRTAAQPKKSSLSDPNKVRNNLEIGWRFPAKDEDRLKGGFLASPIVYKDSVFIGNGDGYFYALNAKDGTIRWRYPALNCKPRDCPPLQSEFGRLNLGNPSSRGIVSSATIAKVHGAAAVIFAAPDPSKTSDPSNKEFGNGHLFALDTEKGHLIWKSQVIARLDGCTLDCKKEFHENLGYSSPLVLGDKVYVGVADHADNPIQQGRVVAVHLETGLIADGFRFCSTGTCGDGTRGGGVGSPPAGLKNNVYVTTGNTRSGDRHEPCPNHGLGLLRLDAATGRLIWKFQPVPWERDSDPDWSAAPTIMSTSCGRVIVSTQKDGWTHAVNAADGSRRWSFPPQECLPFRCGDGTVHGDTKYMRSGAAWGDVYVTMNGGLDLKTEGPNGGYRRLHAFNVCERNPAKRLRWRIDLKPFTRESCLPRCLGNPSIAHGIVYIGTHADPISKKGHLLAIADPGLPLEDQVRERCAHADVPNDICNDMGFRLVPEAEVLADVPLVGSMIYTEPALANGKIYVATDAASMGLGGFVYMIELKRK